MQIIRRWKTNRLQSSLREAMNYEQWLEIAANLDASNGAAAWRERDDSELFDARQIRIRHNRLIESIEVKDRQELLHIMNEGIHGNMGGMGGEALYEKALLGTKHLIEQYIESQCTALREVADAPESEIPFELKLDFFRRASHCFGRSALTMSGGGGLIYFHHGVVDTLVAEGLLSRIVSGSSAGSWMCAQIGSLTDTELMDHFSSKRYAFGRLPGRLRLLTGMQRKAAQTMRDDAVDELVGNLTFQEAFEHTGRYINISIAPFERHQTSRLMNAIASPNVTIRSAVKASSSVPGVVDPVQLEAKDSRGNIKPYLRGRYWVDGSFSEDLPFKRLSRLFGVNHYVVSMINPLALPFVNYLNRKPEGSLSRWALEAATVTTKHGLKAVNRWANPLLPKGVDTVLSTLYEVLDQTYVGNINIVFDYRHANLDQALFRYRNDEEIESMILHGRRAIWPKLSQIRNAVRIGNLIDEILERLEGGSVSKPHEKQLAHITR